MKRRSILSMLCWVVSLGVVSVNAQSGGGDQFLDGIGETAMIACYLFNGNAEDWSRNNFHATVHGNKATFVQDKKFGKVLSLPGGTDGGYVQIPGLALTDTEALSVVGWVYLRDATPWQRFFDLGQDTTRYFFCTPIGEDPNEGYRARVTDSGWTAEKGPVTPRIALNRWVHLTVVLDTAQHTLTTYVNGVRAGQATGVTLTLTKILNQDNGAANHLYLGKSEFGDADLNAKLHDVRFYRIALTAQQVAVIHHNAISKDKITVIPSSTPASEKSTVKTERVTLTEGDQLVAVPDIAVQTEVGTLPHLPYMLTAKYRPGVSGPKVRVIWPAPTDNHQVLHVGTYRITGTVPGTSFTPKATVTVTAATQGPEPKRNLEGFDLGQVILNPDEQGRPTQFMQNRDKFFRTLAQTDPNSFLFNFRDAFGQPQPKNVRPLGVWDSRTCRLRGHASGHYLSALAQAYASTSYNKTLHANFLRKMNLMIDVLYDLAQKSGRPAKPGGPCNADPTAVPPGPGKSGYDSDLSTDGIRTDYWNWGVGFISAYPPDQFIMLEKGATYGGSNRQIWAPYYTLHKILTGLMDCYKVTGNPKALTIARNMGLWVYARLKEVPEETRIKMWNRYIAGEYGGMNEVSARLYRVTGDQRFLACAHLFDNIDFFFGDMDHDHGLARNVDTMRGLHANQHIPQIIGALEVYRDSQDVAYYHIADNFWNTCTHSYAYSIGGVGGAKHPNNGECFTAQPDTLYTNGFNPGAQCETCATYNMLKLSRRLFMYDQDGRYMDYYEQALYNDILSSVAKNSAANTYFIPLNPGSRKEFSNAHMTGFTCCNGTALESNTKLQDTIYFKSTDNQALYVNLYVPSTLTWKARKVVVTQKTSFPDTDTTQLIITGGGNFDLWVRVPRWATRGFTVKINGKDQNITAVPGTYLSLGKTWHNGDTIQLTMPFHFYLNRVMDQPNIASIFYGPVLLAIQESGRRSDWRPVTLDATDVGKSITGDPATLDFHTNGMELKPFDKSYGHYSVYLDVTLK